jgi:polar amino acid transport system substrate-binding protein
VAQAKSLDDLNRSDVTIAYIIGSPQGVWLEQRLPRAKRRGVPGSVADVAIEEITSHRADVANIDKFFFSGLAKKVPGLVSAPLCKMAGHC